MPSDPWVPQRNGGSIAPFKEYPGIEIIEYFCPGAATEIAKEKVVEGITAHGRPLAIIGTNATVSVGIIEGLRAKKMLVPRGQQGHVYVGSLDTPSRTKEDMLNGYVDISTDQPNLAYGFLSVYFLRLIKEKGVDALPPIGSTVICEPDKPEGPQPDGTWNVVPRGQEHEGVTPTDMTYWAPAKVVERYGHRWLQTAVYVSRPETVADAPIWINVVEKWLK